jgi:hypothetical protein
MAAPEGSVSMMSESLAETSNTQLNSSISGDIYPRFVISIDYGTTYTGKNLFHPRLVAQFGASTELCCCRSGMDTRPKPEFQVL